MKQQKSKAQSAQRYGIADLTVGQLNAIVKKLGGPEAAKRLLQEGVTAKIEEKVFREWNGGISTGTVTSRGLNGRAWVRELSRQHVLVGGALDVLQSPEFVSTAVVTYQLMLFPGSYFPSLNCVTSKIRKEASFRGFRTPPAEVACLLREKMADREIFELGFERIIVMHDPIDSEPEGLSCLTLRRNSAKPSLETHPMAADYHWGSDTGFVFVAPKGKL